MPLMPALMRQGQPDLCEFETDLQEPVTGQPGLLNRKTFSWKKNIYIYWFYIYYIILFKNSTNIKSFSQALNLWKYLAFKIFSYYVYFDWLHFFLCWFRILKIRSSDGVALQELCVSNCKRWREERRMRETVIFDANCTSPLSRTNTNEERKMVEALRVTHEVQINSTKPVSEIHPLVNRNHLLVVQLLYSKIANSYDV